VALEHAILRNLDTGDEFPVLFNPAEYSLTKDNTFARAAVPGLRSPLLQFVNGNLATLAMELFFDSFEEHRHGERLIVPAKSDVRELTSRLVDLMAINPETHAPPIVLFAWGDLTFTGVLERAAQRFTMFLDSGTPVRARVSVTFAEYVDAVTEAKETKRQTADFSRTHVVTAGETVSAIAQRAYGDPRRWRPVAAANALANPRRLREGLVLTLPPLPYRDPLTGQVHS
jgi:LysM repeat protein